MKQGKKPTLAERKLIEGKGLRSDNWFVCVHNSVEMIIQHRHTGTTKVIRLG